MPQSFIRVQTLLKSKPKRWLVTGAAGFIGSNLLEFLLRLDQPVIGLDNFSTGFRHNLDEVRERVSREQWSNFSFVEGDIRSLETCQQVCKGVNYVLHQAALGSVPRSIENPIMCNDSNVTGFLNMLVAARDQQVESFTYAASSSTYGDYIELPKVEDKIGKPLSPYAVTKLVNELYADVFAKTYHFKSIGLRYFNIFGPRQDPNGAYAAVIPKWIAMMLKNEPIYINGDGETSRDFCFIENAIQANILAAVADESAKNQVYNVALNDCTTLIQLIGYLKQTLSQYEIYYDIPPIYREFRQGDVRHSQADITKAQVLLGYVPVYLIQSGLEKAMEWYIQHFSREAIIA